MVGERTLGVDVFTRLLVERLELAKMLGDLQLREKRGATSSVSRLKESSHHTKLVPLQLFSVTRYVLMFQIILKS